VALRRSYSVKRDGEVLMKVMSFWQLLTSLFTDRDEDKAVVVVLPPLTSTLRRS
jgi:hypothetical protein